MATVRYAASAFDVGRSKPGTERRTLDNSLPTASAATTDSLTLAHPTRLVRSLPGDQGQLRRLAGLGAGTPSFADDPEVAGHVRCCHVSEISDLGAGVVISSVPLNPGLAAEERELDRSSVSGATDIETWGGADRFLRTELLSPRRSRTVAWNSSSSEAARPGSTSENGTADASIESQSHSPSATLPVCFRRRVSCRRSHRGPTAANENVIDPAFGDAAAEAPTGRILAALPPESSTCATSRPLSGSRDRSAAVLGDVCALIRSCCHPVRSGAVIPRYHAWLMCRPGAPSGLLSSPSAMTTRSVRCCSVPNEGRAEPWPGGQVARGPGRRRGRTGGWCCRCRAGRWC
jgi:hypothetical protein